MIFEPTLHVTIFFHRWYLYLCVFRPHKYCTAIYTLYIKLMIYLTFLLINSYQLSLCLILSVLQFLFIRKNNWGLLNSTPHSIFYFRQKKCKKLWRWLARNGPLETRWVLVFCCKQILKYWSYRPLSRFCKNTFTLNQKLLRHFLKRFFLLILFLNMYCSSSTFDIV